MPKIQELPQNLINQIAAGEVVERPASVIKELVENSLDAGATAIQVTLGRAGRELIAVADNGSGMEPEDARLCLLRHATSKIRSFEDLTHVSSMGFRGEAIPSIASISHFTLTTRAAGYDTAQLIEVKGGQIIRQEPTAAPLGTRIVVEHLFYNVPARRKFLKSDATELAACVATLRAIALAHPGVAFSLVDSRRPILQLPAGQGLRQRIEALFGPEVAAPLIEVNAYDGQAQLSGFISPHTHLQPTRAKLLFYVNSRPVEAKIFNIALREAYGDTLSRGQYPAAFLMLTLPPTEVDVNVHPAKREVRFRAEGDKLSFITRALGVALINSLPTQQSSSSAPLGLSATSPTGLPSLPRLTASPIYNSADYAPSFAPPATSVPFALANLTPQSSIQTSFQVAEPTVRRHGWVFLGFTPPSFAIFNTPEGVAIVSIPAAQERIAADAIANSLAQGATSQSLLIPALLQLDTQMSHTLQAHMAFFTAQGFAVAPFGTGTYRLEAIPAWLTRDHGFAGTPEDFFLAQLHAIAEGDLPTDSQPTHQAIATLAARQAHTPLTHPQAASHLIDRLLGCSNPLKTPSGTPTFWHIPTSEIQRKFQ